MLQQQTLNLKTQKPEQVNPKVTYSTAKGLERNVRVQGCRVLWGLYGFPSQGFDQGLSAQKGFLFTLGPCNPMRLFKQMP